MKALTSLNPNPAKGAIQTACLATWRAAGLEPVSFNHPSEIEGLRAVHAVEYVPVEQTAISTFRRHFIPLNALLEYAAGQPGPVFIVNADLHLQAQPRHFAHMATLAESGMPYLLQWNVDPDKSRGVVEPCGISAFVFNGREFADLFEPSVLCLGEPWWDYWLPYVFVKNGIPLYGAGADLAYHIRHAGGGWTGDDWCTCARELDRMFPLMGEDKSSEACSRMSARVYAEVLAHTRMIDWSSVT